MFIAGLSDSNPDFDCLLMFSSFTHLTHRSKIEDSLQMPIELTNQQVRRLMIYAQGLDRSRRARTATDIIKSIQRMGMLQIDTLSVVNRSHYFVLWSRHGSYPPQWVDALLEDKSLFECWTHEACMAPASWFPYHRRLILDRARSTKMHWAEKYLLEHRAAADAMKAYIGDHGTVRSNEFARPTTIRKDWWDWSHEKQLLEALFASGEVMIARREGFQRVYALAEAVRPDWDAKQLPSADDTATYQILATARMLGVVHTRWLGDYFRMKTTLHRHLERLCAEKKLVEVQIAALPGQAYMLPELVADLATATRKPTHTTLLSPFDPLVWDRTRALDVFGFDYRIECYTSAHKRIYGYFTLPILMDDALIGRVDCKVERKAGVFAIRALHFEQGYVLSPPASIRLAQTFRDCADWHGAEVIDGAAIADDANGVLMRTALAALLPT